MGIESLLIINKSGGLIYYRDFGEQNAHLNSNDQLILASTIHSVFAIASQLTPKAVQLTTASQRGGKKKTTTTTSTTTTITNSSSNNNSNITATNSAATTAHDDSNASLHGSKQSAQHTATTTAHDCNMYQDVIPYVPPRNGSSSGRSSSSKLGSFRGEDFFQEPFVNWNKGGLRQIAAEQTTLSIYQTLTGLKFVAVTATATAAAAAGAPGPAAVDNFLRRAYCLYSDFVMKDPFYSLEMPIRSEKFDARIGRMAALLG